MPRITTQYAGKNTKLVQTPATILRQHRAADALRRKMLLALLLVAVSALGLLLNALS